MPSVFQAQASAEQAVKQALTAEKSGIFDFSRAAFIKKENPEDNTPYVQVIIPLNPKALSSGGERLTDDVAAELSRLTRGLQVKVTELHLRDTFNLLTLRSGKEMVAKLEPENSA